MKGQIDLIIPTQPPAIEIMAESRKSNLSEEAVIVLLETAVLQMRKFRQLLEEATGKVGEKGTNISLSQGTQSDNNSLVR